MGREIPLPVKDETRSQGALVEVRPSVAMKADRYKKWSTSWQEGERKIEAAFDQVVADLIEKYKIVPKDRERGLRDWLREAIPDYFKDRTRRDLHLTRKQADTAKRKIREIGDRLADELARLYELEHRNVPFPPFRWADRPGRWTERPSRQSTRDWFETSRDWYELREILMRAEKWTGEQHTTRGKNAANPALDALGHNIRCFWMTGWTSGLEWHGDLEPPTISSSSGYFKFAKYIYDFVDQGSGDRRVIDRLNRIEKEFGSLQPDYSQYRLFRQALREHVAAEAAGKFGYPPE